MKKDRGCAFSREIDFLLKFVDRFLAYPHCRECLPGSYETINQSIKISHEVSEHGRVNVGVLSEALNTGVMSSDANCTKNLTKLCFNRY